MKLDELLSGEQEQDRQAAAAPFVTENGALFAGREREYNDPEKHWVRERCWMIVAKDIASSILAVEKRRLRYFTLPGYYRLDVSLLLREGLLEITDVDGDGKPSRVYVAAFETDPTKFARMRGHMPAFSLFGCCQVEDALVNPKNPYYTDLNQLFPFDVINLDLTTTLTPHREGPYTRTMQAIDGILARQKHHLTKWAMFLTFRNVPDEWDSEAFLQLLANFQQNLDVHPKVQEAFSKRYNEVRVEALRQSDPKVCLCQAVVKWIVDRAHTYHIQVKEQHCYQYDRYSVNVPAYTITKLALVFVRAEVFAGKLPGFGTPPQPWREDDVASCIARHRSIDVEEVLVRSADKQLERPSELREDVFAKLNSDVDALALMLHDPAE